MKVISFNKNKDTYGWMSNMSPYPIKFGDDTFKTSEALFQSLRFSDNDIKKLIREEKSPMGAKDIMNANSNRMIIEKHSDKDVQNMMLCLRLKIAQHPNLKDELIKTGTALIVEDVTKRGDVGGNLFWGMMLVDDNWIGKNILGNLWMELRKEFAFK